MPCYHPLTAYKLKSGGVVFNELRRHGEIFGEIQLSCGQCHGCRLERSRRWAMRCMHEASMYKNNCFITLTYAEENLPPRNNLYHRDWELFMKRLRKHAGNKILKFYMAGEYGPSTQRPHFHAIVFNHDWTDKKFLKTTGSGERIYESDTLRKLWRYGHTSTGNATFESAAYIARYCMSKVTGDAAYEHYRRYDHLGEYTQVPEYNEMSNGIGMDWLKFFRKDVYNNDYIIINGHQSRTPAYYDKLYKRWSPEEMDEIKAQREYDAYQHRDDNTPERLAVKEQVAKAKIKFLKRGEI